MSGVGHSLIKVARIYLHARRGRDKEIATALGAIARRELKRSHKQKKPEDKARDRSGTQRARERKLASG